MSDFERRFGKYALRNLPLIMIICYAVGYAISYISPGFQALIGLDPYKILHGQIWRLVTWLLIPPTDSNVIWVIIMLFCYYSIGISLERTWGTYKFNVYIFSGILLNLVGAFLLTGVLFLAGGSAGAELMGSCTAVCFNTYYINMSILLAFALTFPDAMFLFMFFIPVKAKWMAVLYGVFLIIPLISDIRSIIVSAGTNPFSVMLSLANMAAILAPLINLFIFYMQNKKGLGVRPVQMMNRSRTRTRAAEPKRDLSRSSGRVTRHKCAVCGRTEEDVPNMQFRFCTKCEGNYEYCEDHLYTHNHVRMS